MANQPLLMNKSKILEAMGIKPLADEAKSPAEKLASLSETERRMFFTDLTDSEANYLTYAWEEFWARPSQIVPKSLGREHFTWLILAGRGYGKSRTGAETVRKFVMDYGYKNIALVGRTSSDARNVMVEGPSGIMSVFPPDERPLYEPAKRKLTFVTGAVGYTYSADKPEQLRGPQHDFAWSDELAAWRYDDAWDQLQFGLRLGASPVNVVTTTPRPVKIVKDLITDNTTFVTRGSTFENIANLALPALRKLLLRYQGTRLGLQELEAQILEDTPGALWTRQVIEKSRQRLGVEVPPMVRIVIGIDPSVTSNEDSDETGIVAVGIDRFNHIYVLDDCSMRGRPNEWAKAAINLYDALNADRIIAEVNNGGDMVETTIRTERKNVPFKQVRATKGKYTRAEPVSSLYEQGRVHHVGIFSELEDQMCTWVAGEKSPDRLDALVWAITELDLKNVGGASASRTSVRNIYSSGNRSENKWG